MRNLRLSAVAAVLVILAARVLTDAWAQEQWETLRGHKTMRVRVSALNDDAKAMGLTEERLQTIVELRLRQAGIGITIPRMEELRLPQAVFPIPIGYDSPSLNISTTAVPLRSGGPPTGYACYIGIRFRQEVLFAVDTLLITPVRAFAIIGTREAQKDESKDWTGMRELLASVCPVMETDISEGWAATWESGILITGPPSSYPQHAEKGLDDCLDEFINDWLKANPKE